MTDPGAPEPREREGAQPREREGAQPREREGAQPREREGAQPRDPAAPEPLSLQKRGAAWSSGPEAGEPVDVGEFRPGSPMSQWALARYLVGRAIAESVGTSLMIVALGILVLAGLIWWAGSVFWAVVVGVIALGVLLLRALLLAVLRRLTAAGQYGPLHDRLRALVSDTRSDVLRELRRIGLPGRTWTLPLLAVRLLRGSRRRDTVERLKTFQVARAVPPARSDELHLLLQSRFGGRTPPTAGR